MHIFNYQNLISFGLVQVSLTPHFILLNSLIDFTRNLTNHSLWCPDSCQPQNDLGKFLILKLRCQYNNSSKPCLTTKHIHWDRAPFICLTNQTIKQEKQVTPAPIHISPSYSSKNFSR